MKEPRQKVFFALEHPADPCSYGAQGNSEYGHASLWHYPEMCAWEREYDILRAQFDQGWFGHCRVKPTVVATGNWKLWQQLHGQHLSAKQRAEKSQGMEAPDWRERAKKSKSWAAWAPGLATAIWEAFAEHVPREASDSDERVERSWLASHCPEGELKTALLRKAATLESFQEHCARGHMPWRKDCAGCLYGMSRARPHFRQVHRSAHVLHLDR